MNMYAFPEGLKRLEAFLGANGVMTSQIDTYYDVIWIVNKLFELDGNVDVSEDDSFSELKKLQRMVAELGRRERGTRIRRNYSSIPPVLISKKGYHEIRLKQGKRKGIRKAMKKL